ncbi:hypothetical protein [Blastococcus sp. CT_GayMR16]|uniref:hypothetical protein n=1 Tax=Blastococcus sp. CT_GayMR16 TaxID=2559607 RepID=UPI001074141C|nr:hypothetical protein [Blastococcus sp. CT_GayMR16]TFV83144.1 hypothetical protein E4P38_21040 [Blastococcus sp. CT_GayMR16]
MGHTIEVVPLSKLLLDEGNPRLEDPEESQRDTVVELTKQQGHKLIELAKDIVDFGLDPLALPAVVATDGRSRRYKVVEGNRRTLALKALETPSIVLSALSEPDRRQLAKLSERFHSDPIENVTCVLFDSEEDARHWVKIRHTGQNSGVGLVEWNSDEKDRYDARHGGRNRTLGGQALDFLRELDGPPPEGARRVAVTTVTRILKTPAVRERLGLTLEKGRLLAQFPQQEVARGLRRIVEDLRNQAIKVGDVFDKEQQLGYLERFSADDLPDPATKLAGALPFEELPVTGSKPRAAKPRAPKARPKPATARVTLVPSDCRINPAPPRINAVFTELSTLDVTTFPNAASVLLRVFVELSVDHYIDHHGLMDETKRHNTVLAARLKATSEHLYAANKIPEDLRRAITRIADGRHTIAASVATFHAFVHNPYVHPRPTELQTAWDELQPFLEKVWA